MHAREPIQEAAGGNAAHHDEVRRASSGGQRALRSIYRVGQLHFK